MRQIKVSAVFLAFVEPVFVARGGPPVEMYREIFRIAVLVWNAVNVDDHDGTNYISDVRARLQSSGDTSGPNLMLALVEDFIDRKRTAFAEHKWLVGNWEVFYQAQRRASSANRGPTAPPYQLTSRGKP